MISQVIKCLAMLFITTTFLTLGIVLLISQLMNRGADNYGGYGVYATRAVWVVLYLIVWNASFGVGMLLVKAQRIFPFVTQVHPK